MNITRRGLTVLGATLASTTALPGHADAVHADAGLIALCAEFDACEMRMREIFDTDHSDEAEDDVLPVRERIDELLDQMVPMRATTTAGIMARARTLAVHAGDGGFSLDIDDTTTTGRLVAALLRDTLLMSGLPVPVALTEALEVACRLTMVKVSGLQNTGNTSRSGCG